MATSTLGQVSEEQTKTQVPSVLAVAKAYIFVMQSGMRVVAKQHLSAVAKLMGVTEEQTIKVFTAERKALNVGDEVGVVKKGHEVA